jgi:hypothetical protein
MVNSNNAVINNYYRKLQGLILLLINPIRIREGFFQIYTQFGLELSNRFASPVLDGLISG